ncbi:MAG: LysM peptidoglycan-binding domain-containing protein [Bacteroidota bacterium]
MSRQYGMSVQQLKDWNGIQDNELKIGQVLSVAAPALATTTPVATTATPVCDYHHYSGYPPLLLLFRKV